MKTPENVVQVITYESTTGAKIDVCKPCSKRTPWPKDGRGNEYATVSRGLHAGGCMICGAGLAPWESRVVSAETV